MSKSTLTCASCGKAMRSGRTSKPQGEAYCDPCRREGKAVEHGTQHAYRQHKCRCDTCRAAHNARIREYNRKRKERDGVSATAQSKRRAKGLDPVQEQKPCGHCGDPVGMNRGSEVPYHRECRYKVPAWRREGRESPRVERFRKRIERAASGTTGGGRVFYAGPCSWCGENESIRLGWYCSQKCKGNANQALRGKFVVKRSVRLAIYERDGWTCQLCGDEVSPDAPRGSNWSATLDHVVPQSATLIPDHSPENLRLAHMWCNAARGDGSGFTMGHAEFMERVKQMRLEVAA